MNKYNRFMVFEWSDYDNVDPFSCVKGHYLHISAALHYAKKMKDDDDHLNYCIFDRLEGVVVWESKSSDQKGLSNDEIESLFGEGICVIKRIKDE